MDPNLIDPNDLSPDWRRRAEVLVLEGQREKLRAARLLHREHGTLADPDDAHVTKAQAQSRKDKPLFTGCLAYFPDALLAVAELSRVANEQHNPGTPVHWDRAKSRDEADALARHLLDHGKLDTDGTRHTAKVAWRALALLQKEIEAERITGPE